MLKPYKNIEKIELLPYQTMGIDKYKDLNIPYKLENVPYLDNNKLEELQRLIEKD